MKGFSKKLLLTLTIFLGVYLNYASTLIIFQGFIANSTSISRPLSVFFGFIVGLILIGFGVGQFKRRSDYLLYLSIPLMSLILGFLFTLAPLNWHGELFGWISQVFFPLILFVFYCLKEYFTSNENELK